jgi:hypothetical protein
MLTHRFKNLNVKCGSTDFLVNGIAYYSVEEYDEGNEATFEKAEIYDALGSDGYVTSKECLGYISDATLETLNKDHNLCRQLGNKLV